MLKLWNKLFKKKKVIVYDYIDPNGIVATFNTDTMPKLFAELAGGVCVPREVEEKIP